MQFQQKFQPAYEYTILTETFPTDIYQFETTVDLESTVGGDTGEKDAIAPGIEIKQEEVGEEETQKANESDDPMLGEGN